MPNSKKHSSVKKIAPASRSQAASRLAASKRAKGKGSKPATAKSGALRAKRPEPSTRASKAAQVVALLRRTDGATMEDLMAATAWQRHMVRGFLSGVLRKKQGLNVQAVRTGASTKARII